MRFSTSAVAGLAALGIAMSAGSALAGGYGCEAAECYEKVRRPDVYATVERPVVVRPGYGEVVHTPAAVLERVRRIEMVPGSFNVHREPAVYGSYTSTVMVAPSRTVHEHIPASYRTVQQTEVWRPASVRWERRVDRHGRETMCKVVVPAVTRTVARNVMVSPGQSFARVVPAQFAQVQRPMLVQPARTVQSYNPPVHAFVREPMVVRPAMREVIQHPPVIAYERQEILVRRGGTAWAPVGHRREW
jgi:hypothetical protein